MGNLSLNPLTLTMVRPSDADAVRDWFEVRCAVARVDRPDDPPPCWTDHLGRLRHPDPGEQEIVWLARLDGTVVASCLLQLPRLDNLETAGGRILVAPGYRRRGVGRALLDHLRTEAVRHSRIRLIFETDQPLDPALPDPGGRFAAASGAVCALVETRRRLDLGSVDPEVLAGLERQARDRSAGYSLVQWVGDTPQRRLDEVAYLTGRMSTDAPLDDLQWGPESYDAARIQAQEVGYQARGLHRCTTGAVDGGGRLVAFTQISVGATSRWHGWQGDTIVAPEHRGHRLGTLVKVANLELARAQCPELRAIDTWNADSNPYMVHINEAMGFRPQSRAGEWQLDLQPVPRRPSAHRVQRVE